MWIALAAGWVVYAGGIGWYAAAARDRPAFEGIALGVLAGPFGWLLVAALPAPATVPAGRGGHIGHDEDEDEKDRVDADLWDTHEIMGMPIVRP